MRHSSEVHGAALKSAGCTAAALLSEADNGGQAQHVSGTRFSVAEQSHTDRCH